MPAHLRQFLRCAAALAIGVPALLLAMSAGTAAQTPVAKAPHAVNLTAKLKTKPQGAAFVGTGPASGTPFGIGRAKTRSTIKTRSPLRTSTTLTVVTTKGNAVFKGTGRYVGKTFRSTMKAFSGAGRYRGIEGSNLAVSIVTSNGVDRLRMTGTVRYGAAAIPTAP
jgi:hypothetical protein